jgi:hypothetical protein
MNLIRNWDTDLDNGWMIWGWIPSGFKRFFLFYKTLGLILTLTQLLHTVGIRGIMWSGCDFDDSSPSTVKFKN